MKLNAVAVTSSDMKKTANFYRLLGFTFPELKEDDQHLEPFTPDKSARLMIDAKSIVKDIIGEDPQPGNHSSFAIEYDNPAEVDRVVEEVFKAKGKVVREPWDAFWGQRYAIVKDPDGYKIDLYVAL